VDFSVSDEYKVASAGKTLKKIQKDGISTYTFSLDNARSFSMVLSKYFSVKTENKNGVEVGYYYYDDNNPDQSFDYILKSLDFFGEKFGKYAYSSYSVVQTKFVQGGMEYPTLVMISDNLDEKSYGEVIVHETAHQWWQVAVGNNEIEYGFLDEGLSEYSVILFYENHSEYGLTRESLVKSALQTYKIYCSVYDKVFGKVNTSMVRSLTTFDSEYDYVNIAYIKPCIMYDNLRQTIGDNRFFEGLKRYYKQYKYKNANPYDIVGVYEKIGADTNGFFTSFYDGKVIL
jgi:aminopeptidase N